MIALVDYDNSPLLLRNRGLTATVTRVLSAMGSGTFSTERVLQIRLYGGWFRGRSMSPRAQQLVPQVRADFPRLVTVADENARVTVLVRAELAYSLACDPDTHLTHTYRTRSVPTTLRCAALPFRQCTNPSACPIAGVESLVNDDECPGFECPVRPSDLLERPEQKLVDTMMTVDLVDLARRRGQSLAVVSRDDDMWPGIRLALLSGATIVHVRPGGQSTIPRHYMPLTVGRYTHMTF